LTGTATSPVREQGRRANAVRHRRLDVEIKLTHQAGDGKPGIALNGDAWVRTDALRSAHGEPLVLQLRARLLSAIPGFASELQKPQVMFLESVGCDGGRPPLRGRGG
jgi:hypothetical protein